MNKERIKGIVSIIIVIIIFITASYFSSTYAEYIKGAISDYSILGMFIYVIGLTIATILGPVTLLPVAVTLWGPLITALLTTIGWTIGAIIAFSISKKYGRNLVEKLIKKDQLDWLKKRIPKNNLFISIIVFRIVIPIDFVSYAIGLFTKIELRPYALATFIGTLPLCFTLAYSVSLSIKLKIGVLVLGLLILGFGYIRSKSKNK